jgi:hypothetical protein
LELLARKVQAMLINFVSLDVVCVAYQIATHYLKETGQIPAEFDIYQPLFDSIVSDFRAGSRNKLRLANRAIARIEKANCLLELILRDDDISRINSSTWVTWDDVGPWPRMRSRAGDATVLPWRP